MAEPDLAAVEHALRSVSATQGFNAWLGCELVLVGRGEVEVALGLRPDLTQHHGFAHGGVVSTLADIACAWASATVAGDVVTAGYSIQFLAPAKGERLRAEGRVLRAGRRQVSVEARVYAETEGSEPKLVAVALGSVTPVGS